MPSTLVGGMVHNLMIGREPNRRLAETVLVRMPPMGITSKKARSNFAPSIKSNTISNVKYDKYVICRNKSCDQNETTTSRIEMF